MNKYLQCLVLVILVLMGMLFMFGMWTMEIGEICMRQNPECMPTNGFMNFDAVQTYHVGLYLMQVSFMVVVVAATILTWLSRDRA